MRASDSPARLTTSSVGGAEKRELVLIDHDPAGPRPTPSTSGASDRRSRSAVQVERIGSTSVPGLAAKPIIDVLVVVEDITPRRTT